MPSWNVNRDKEFVDNLRLDYGTMDTTTLRYARDILYDDLYVYGNEMRPTTRATKQLRLEVLDEILAERGIRL